MQVVIAGNLRFTQGQKSLLSALPHKYFFHENEKAVFSGPEKIEVVICNSFFEHNPIEKFKNLKLIQATSAGLDRIPLEYCRGYGIKVLSARGAYCAPVSEWVVMSILNLYKNTYSFFKKQEKRLWEKEKDLSELGGKRVTIVGMGSIGLNIAKKLKAFDACITAVDIDTFENFNIDKHIHTDNLSDVLVDTDILIVAAPLTPLTKGLICREKLNMLPDKAIVIVCSRGGIVDEKHLSAMLEDGKLQGAALDVFDTEPLPEDSLLWNTRNLIISPHNSFAGEHNGERLFKIIYETLKR